MGLQRYRNQKIKVFGRDLIPYFYVISKDVFILSIWFSDSSFFIIQPYQDYILYEYVYFTKDTLDIYILIFTLKIRVYRSLMS